MTTYELPPEPEVGARVRDHHGHVWTHTNDGWSHPELRSSGLSWGAVMAYASPAELIEPDPWPTDELIVASVDGGAPQLLVIQDDHTAMTMTGALCRRDRNTLTNVVPVHVVAAAEWEAMAQTVRSLTAPGTEGSLLNQAQMLVAATDALGLDQ